MEPERALSEECTKSEIDLFTLPPTQKTVDAAHWEDHSPINTIDNFGPIEFFLTGAGDDFIDPASIYLHLLAKVTALDGTAIADDAEVGPVNNWMHTLISNVDVILNEKIVSSSNGMYGYQAFIENLISYGNAAESSQLASVIWKKDTHGKVDTIGATNLGYAFRKGKVAKSKFIDLVGRLHTNLTGQERYLINGVNCTIKLERSADAFALMGAENTTFKVFIRSATLYARKVKLSPTENLKIIRQLEYSNIKMPIRNVQLKTFTIPAGTISDKRECVFTGQLPTKLIIGFVDNDAFNGIIHKSPFNFKHYRVNSINIVAGGHIYKPYKPNFADNLYCRSYVGLFQTLGKFGLDEGALISREEYAEGYTLYGFDLTPDCGGEDHWNVKRSGSVRIETSFAVQTTATINCICYAEFENLIEIDRNRNIIIDYSP